MTDITHLHVEFDEYAITLNGPARCNVTETDTCDQSDGPGGIGYSVEIIDFNANGLTLTRDQIVQAFGKATVAAQEERLGRTLTENPTDYITDYQTDQRREARIAAE